MARISDYPTHEGSTDGAYALIAADLGGGAFRLRWVPAATLGNQGEVGPPGPTGPASTEAGPEGEKGATGAQGPAGPAGPNGALGRDADIVQPNLSLDDAMAFDIFEAYADGQSSGLNAGRGWSGDWNVSGGSIVTRTSHNGRQQKRLRLVNGEMSRRFKFGSVWNKIQVGILFRIDSLVAIPAMNFYFGVCSDTVNTASSASCANFIGAAGQGITWTPDTLTQQTVQGSSGMDIVSRRGNTTSLIGASAPISIPSAEAGLGVIWLQISRAAFASDASAVSYAMNFRAVPAEPAGPGISVAAGYSMLKEGFVNAQWGGIGTDKMTGGVSTSVAPSFDQSTGVLDAFNFFWDSSAPVEVAGVAVRKVY